MNIEQAIKFAQSHGVKAVSKNGGVVITSRTVSNGNIGLESEFVTSVAKLLSVLGY